MDSNIIIKNENTSLSVGSLDEAKVKPLITQINKSLPEIKDKTNIFSRSNSQHSLSLMSLTMLNGKHPYRMLRQCLSEIESRENALFEAQLGVAEKKAELAELEEKIKNDPDNEVLKAKYLKVEHDLKTVTSKMEGAIKDIAVLSKNYEDIKKTNNIDDWSEEDFEYAEKEFHVRRGFELLYRNLIEVGRGKDAVIEYLQQHGVHYQIALREVLGYIKVTDKRIDNGEVIDADDIENFLDEMAKKYTPNVTKRVKSLFSRDESSVNNLITR